MRFTTNLPKFLLYFQRSGASPAVDPLQGVAYKRSVVRAARKSDIQLLGRKILELIDEHGAVVQLIEAGYFLDIEQALCVPEQVVEVEDALTTAFGFDLLGEDIATRSECFAHLIVIVSAPLRLGQSCLDSALALDSRSDG